MTVPHPARGRAALRRRSGPAPYLLLILLLAGTAASAADVPPPRQLVIDQADRVDKTASEEPDDWRLTDFVGPDLGDPLPAQKKWDTYEYATNDFTALATDKVFVIHVFVDDPGTNWADVPAYRHDKEDMVSLAGDACEWLIDQAPASANLDFSNQGNPRVHHFYTATIDTTIPNGSTGGTNWVEAAVADIGFTDTDGDGTLVDELLGSVLFDNPDCQRALALFHPYRAGRSYARKTISRAVLYPRNSWDGLNTPSDVFAHEILHLFGATDEYEEDGECPRYQCNDVVHHRWLDVDYLNLNCEACAEDPARCIMRISEPVLPVIICRHTEGHIGWGDHDEVNGRDFYDTHPFSDWFSGPDNQVVGDSWFNCNAKGWTAHGHIDQMQYQVGDTINPLGWIGASPYDGTWDEFEESVSFTVDLEEGWNTVWVQAHNDDGQWQHDFDIVPFNIYRDTTGPLAPTVYASPNTNPDRWYNTADVTVTWYEPYDFSDVVGYSWLIDTWPTTPVTETNMGDVRQTTFTADLTANWYVHVAAVDEHGNWGDQTDHRIRVDLTPPIAPPLTAEHHDEGVWSNSRAVRLAHAAIDTGAGIDRFAIVDDRSATTVLSSGAHYPGDTTTVYVDEGVSWIHVAARDLAGNWGPTSHFEVWTETTPPVAPTIGHTSPAEGATWYATSAVTFEWNTPATPPGIAGYSYDLGAGIYVPTPDELVDTPDTVFATTGLTSGPHTLAVRALDHAGNWGQTGRRTIHLDTTPPDTVRQLRTTSHPDAIGASDPVQSADATVDITFWLAQDAHSGTVEYAVLWDQAPATVPTPTSATSLGAETDYTSPELDTGSWYAHVRPRDAVGNWGQTMHLGPIVIDVTPPGTPLNLTATPASSLVDLAWTPPGDPDIDHYVVYASDDPDQLGAAVASDVTGTTWQHGGLVNGDWYYYRVAAVDVVDLVSTPSAQEAARPEYVSPGNGSTFAGLGQLAVSSGGGVRGGGGQYTMHGSVTITAPDILAVGAGEQLLSMDRTGTDRLVIQGGLQISGSAGDPAVIGSAHGEPGDWGGIHLDLPQVASSIRRADIRHAATNVYWRGDPDIQSSQIGNASGNGLELVVTAGGGGTVSDNDIFGCGLYGVSVDAAGQTTTTVDDNRIRANQHGIFWDTAPAGTPPINLTIQNNEVWSNSMDGIRCGRGDNLTLIDQNSVHGNHRGIVCEFEGTLGTAPRIWNNDVYQNDLAGIYVADQALPDIAGNRIVDNRRNGVYCVREGMPTLRGNTITSSQVGVHVANTTLVPDLGVAGSDPGYNRLDGHTVYVQNLTTTNLNAQSNYWGSAQLNPAAVVVGPVAWNPTWNVNNGAPSVSPVSPTAPVTVSDEVTIEWDAIDPDPGDVLTFSLYCLPDTVGAVSAPIAGAALLDDQPGPQTFVWDVRQVDPGTYRVGVVCSDGTTTDDQQAAGTVEIVRPSLAATPDSVSIALVREDATTVTINVANGGDADVTVTLGEDDGAGGDVSWLVVPGSAQLVAAGGDVDLDVDLSAAGLDDDVHRGTVTVTADDTSLPVLTVALELTVTHPQLALGAASLDLGTADTGLSRQAILNAWNAGSADLTVGAPTGLDAPFTAVWLDGTTVAPGDSLRLRVDAVSGFRGVFPDTVLLLSDDPGTPTSAVPLAFAVQGPDLVLAAGGHDFGAVATGDTAWWILDLSNVGEDSLSVASIGADDTAFLVDFTAALALAPGDTADVAVGFAPQAPGAFVGQLLLAHDDPGGPGTADLDGTGRAGSALFAETVLDFGATELGATDTLAAWLGNHGDAMFTVATAVVDSPFHLLSTGAPWDVAPADSLALLVGFQPFHGGPAAGTLAVTTSGADGATPTLRLDGDGAWPDLAWDADEYAYGTVAVGAAADTSFVLRNPGAGAVTVAASFAVGSDFTIVSPTFPLAIAGGDSALVTIRYQPSGVGASLDTLTVSTPWSFLADGAFVLDGSGGEADLSLADDRYDFFSIELGETHLWNLPVTNAGDVPVEVTVPPLASPFTPIDTVRVLVPAGGVAGVAITCTPTGLGAWMDTVQVWWGNPPQLLGSVALSAASSEAVLAPPPALVAGDVFENDVGTVDLVIGNTGNHLLSYAILENAGGKALADKSALPPVADIDADWLAEKAADIVWADIAEPVGQVWPDSTVSVTIDLASTAYGPGVYTESLLLLTSDADAESTSIDLRMRVPRMRYATHDAGDLVLTVTDEGCLGFFDAQQVESYGAGLRWPSSSASHLVHGSLWVGDGPGRVSDGSFDYDFAVVPGQELSFAAGDTQSSSCVYSDSLAALPLGLRVAQGTHSFGTDGTNDVVIVEYALTAATPLSDVYVGLYLEADIGNFQANGGGYLAAEKLGEMYATDGSETARVGVVALDPAVPSAFRMVHNPTYVWPTADIPDTAAWNFMTSGVFDTSVPSPDDYSMVLVVGPVSLGPGAPVRIPFAVVAAGSQTDLRNQATAAQSLYHDMVSGTGGAGDDVPRRFALGAPYPNPFNPVLHIPVQVPPGGEVARVDIYDVRGRLVATPWHAPLEPGRRSVLWRGTDRRERAAASGVYFVRLRAGGTTHLRKVMLVR